VHVIGEFGVGMHLAELCREEYPRFVNICLWIIAELAVISDDIPEGSSVIQFVSLCALCSFSNAIFMFFFSLLQCWAQPLHSTYCSRSQCGLESSSQCSAPSCFLGCRDLGYAKPYLLFVDDYIFMITITFILRS